MGGGFTLTTGSFGSSQKLLGIYLPLFGVFPYFDQVPQNEALPRLLSFTRLDFPFDFLCHFAPSRALSHPFFFL
jgi:hypothetical protein